MFYQFIYFWKKKCCFIELKVVLQFWLVVIGFKEIFRGGRVNLFYKIIIRGKKVIGVKVKFICLNVMFSQGELCGK